MRAWARAWIGRAVRRRIRRKGIDLSNIPFLPEGAKAPLQRHGTDPVPRVAELRATEPVHRLPLPFDFAVHLVTAYEPARALLAEPTSWSTDIRHLFSASDGASADDVGGLGFTDPPQHTRLRRMVTPEFTAHRMARLEPMIEGIVARRLDAMEAAGPPVDLVRELAFPVPFQTIRDLLGLGDEDGDAIAGLGGARFDASGGGAAAFGAVSAQRSLLHEAVVRQRGHPGPGLIGQILREHGDEISDVDLAGLADGILTGGYETTAGMISMGVLVLLRDPAHVALVRDGSPAEVGRAVEELLRYLTVVQIAFPRFAKQDMTVHGHPVRAGEAVIASLSGANRDPAWAGAEPDRFDPERVPVGGHLAFGHGIHRCVGAELARMELRIVLPALLRRFPGLALAVPEERLSFRQLSFVHGVEEVPVRW